MLIDHEKRSKLIALGVSCLHGTPFQLPTDTVIEPPCSLKWMQVNHSLRMGAFSYAVSGYYFAASIGRYTSIGENVQIGRGSHPVDWASTSPVFYQNHVDVVDHALKEAQAFVIKTPYIAPRETKIGSDVYIGHGAFIMQGVTIGDGAVIAAQSVVTKDVPPYAVVAGVPAVVKRFRFDDAVIARMLNIRWWRYAFWDLNKASIVDPKSFLDSVEEITLSGVLEYQPPLVSIAEL